MVKKFSVYGMSCSACSTLVEKTVKNIKGVKSARVNLLNKSLIVELNENVLDEVIIKAIVEVGYTAEVLKVDTKEEKTPKTQLYKLIISVVLTLIITYLSMSKTWGLYIPSKISSENSPIIFVLLLMTLTLFVIVLNSSFFIKGYKSLFKLSPNMDTLIAVGSSSSFLYGLYCFIMIVYNTNINCLDIANSYLNNLYFESASMILTIVRIGKLLEEKAKNRTNSAVKMLKKLSKNTAKIIIDDTIQEVEISKIKINDIVVIKQGESVSLDGEIIEGEGDFDESSLTGESLPKFKKVGDKVLSSTILLSGYIKFRVTATNEETILSKIIDFVENAENSKPSIQTFADKVSGIFVPTIMCLATITFICWLIISKNLDMAITMGVSVLVISCPCALGLATPVAVTVSMGVNAKNGILIKNAEKLEQLDKVKTIIFDKTGTITKGELSVKYSTNFKAEDIVAIKSIEEKSQHLVAVSVVNYYSDKETTNVKNFYQEIGKGVSGEVYGHNYKIGNKDFVKNDKNLEKFINLESGCTILYVSKNNQVIGRLEISDTIRENSKLLFEYLKKASIKTVVLSGDNVKAVEEVSKTILADEYYGEILPEEKAKIVETYKKSGVTCFVGDGINDSPSLVVADIGISVASGEDIATKTSDIILMKNNLLDLVNLINLGKKTIKVIKQNLFWAFFYNVLMIPVASGIFYKILTLNPIISSVCMSLSSIIVVTNALRLKKFKEIK